ncbi:hypothetical protein HanXRQr2_Chr03g0135101 [Helianthus annuus]|uniref:Uncharacterized protein n=1 Tax=Helianthus annuus TaxID=4232 RepID=A0A9K3JKI0_HELAN|nr:hypothetical protein HanXRQr2_Chr03g0135101 [Helianthus annuus]KAJ0945765.1 hypothetical protein HanPSC8_Chr03g0131761 [Helianthus annuus]
MYLTTYIQCLRITMFIFFTFTLNVRLRSVFMCFLSFVFESSVDELFVNN